MHIINFLITFLYQLLHHFITQPDSNKINDLKITYDNKNNTAIVVCIKVQLIKCHIKRIMIHHSDVRIYKDYES